MKRILIIAFLSLLSAFSLAKGLQPEEVLENSDFSKNENGVVIFKNAFDLLNENGDYPFEQNRAEVISEDPLKIRLSTVYVDDESDKFTKLEQQQALIYAVYQIFTHTKYDSLDITINSVNFDMINPENQKVLKNKPQINLVITREKALRVLKQVAKVDSFDSLVVLQPTSDLEVIGYSPSKNYQLLTSDEIRPLVVKYLLKK
ncbi:hypothetical protein [Pasteurella multocida]|uniref:Uncharacterized protein n=1 Tax=Pasteurella multocida TaxID=747 RepID=A0AAW8VAI4_PASMD|nr:hypothetical protein [Pasteurella multocida]MDH7436455.1 hypothetical protein [Pasteurella multocida]MDH7439744.1 hypothetical protein [Pasteurella multocida]MDT3453376.1 hypothetical protein [Pasteurella multocida]MDY0478850.1 hypothetical protein [Pasteurella multocida]MDY0494786.1 hypothetical protein [Pasteurella multocida]